MPDGAAWIAAAARPRAWSSIAFQHTDALHAVQDDGQLQMPWQSAYGSKPDDNSLSRAEIELLLRIGVLGGTGLPEQSRKR